MKTLVKLALVLDGGSGVVLTVNTPNRASRFAVLGASVAGVDGQTDTEVGLVGVVRSRVGAFVVSSVLEVWLELPIDQ